MAEKLLVLADPLSDEGLEILKAAGGIRVEDRSNLSRSELLESLAGISGLIVRSATQADAELLRRAESLEVIGRAGVGLDNIDLEEATRRGIAIINAPAGNTTSTAEHAFALLLSLARGLPAAAASMRVGAWDRKAFRGAQVAGKVLGVVGAGRIGTEVIRRGRAFGMDVIVADPFLTSSRADSLRVETFELSDLMARADFVTIHVPLVADTHHLIGAREISLMKPGAFLINAARGGIVDEDALVAALQEGRLAGAALDVFEVEPLPKDHPLRSCPNLIMTPHIGASTPEAQREVAIEIARAVRDALLDGELGPAVNLPTVTPEERPEAEALLDLARRLGLLLGELSGAATEKISIRCTSRPDAVQRLAASAALEGFLNHRLAGPLNMINAHLRAEERGIEVSTARVSHEGRGRSWIELAAVSEGRTRTVAGKVTSHGEPRLLQVDAYRLEATPRGTLLFIGNEDVPGVIGSVGTHLAEARVNIAEFHQARNRETGAAMGVVSLDGDLPPAGLETLKSVPGVRFVRQVRLPDWSPSGR